MGETLKRKSHSPPVQPPKRQKLEVGKGKGSMNPSNSAIEENSDTEFSSEEEQVSVRTSQKATPQLVREHTGSTTEDDSDIEVLPPSQKVASPPPVPIAVDDSATESDHDVDDLQEALHAQKRKPKPGFELKEGQQIEPPLILDRAQGIKVPSPINTYLRPYQRDGVQFFWRQYSEGRGGLLGDDMGLGKTIQVISFLSAIMKKEGISSDRNRRKKYVSKLQDGEQWAKYRTLPPANAKWPTCLIVCPNAVVHNWKREFEKVCLVQALNRRLVADSQCRLVGIL
jgi:DNA excision repair protein ERCC-6-like 2